MLGNEGNAIGSWLVFVVQVITLVAPPSWRLTCSRAQRAVSIVRCENSRFDLVSLIIVVTHSWRKASTSWPSGYVSARSLQKLVSNCMQANGSLQPRGYLPDNTHRRSHERLAAVHVVGNNVEQLEDGLDVLLKDLRLIANLHGPNDTAPRIHNAFSE